MRCFSLFLSSLLLLNPVWAQVNPTPPAAVVNPGGDALHLNVVDDPGPAQPHSASAKGYIFQVTNAAGLPVAGVAVSVRLPDKEPTGHFANGLSAWVAYSDASGIVRFPIIQWAAATGTAELKATAAKGSAHAALALSQNIGNTPANTPNSDISVVSVPVEAKPVAPVPAPAPPLAPVIAVAASPAPKPSKPLADILPQKPATAPTKPAPAPVPEAPKDTVPPGVAPDSTASKSTITLPQDDLALLTAPKPKLPPLPTIVVEVPAPSSKPLADITPTVPTPGTPAPVPRSQSGASVEEAHTLKPDPPAPTTEEPAISITNSPTGAAGESHKKVWILVAVGAGAGVGAMLALLGHGGATGSGSTAGVSIGSPTITVGPGH